MPRAAVLNPAYRPGEALPALVEALLENGFAPIVVVDDGSGPEYGAIFARLSVTPDIHILRHAVNLGKGAALKSGMNFILVGYPETPGAITVDADGQHHPADVAAVARVFAAHPESLVLGSRAFAGPVPLRSRLGISITQTVMRFVAGQRLSDTQTGLRAVPRRLMERMLSVPAAGYEFELEMLIAAKHLGFDVIEQPIRTIYEAGNPT